MNSLFLTMGGAKPDWIRHHLPWLGMLALVFGLARDDDSETDSLNG